MKRIKFLLKLELLYHPKNQHSAQSDKRNFRTFLTHYSLLMSYFCYPTPGNQLVEEGKSGENEQEYAGRERPDSFSSSSLDSPANFRSHDFSLVLDDRKYAVIFSPWFCGKKTCGSKRRIASAQLQLCHLAKK